MTRASPFVLFGVLLAASQVDAQTPPIFEFSFSNPGARSMGLGGAFAGLADDATAAFANPAGLVQLLTPEISVEGRFWSYSTPFTLGGRLDGQPTGNGLDRAPGLRMGESSQELAGLSFLSFVYPRSDWSIAVYRHQSANFEFQSESQGFFGDAPPPFTVRREDDIRMKLDLDLVSYGVVRGLQSEGRAQPGGRSLLRGRKADEPERSVRSDRSEPAGRFLRSEQLRPGCALGVEHCPQRRLGLDLQLGVLWRVSRQWSLGGFFRQGPGFRLRAESVSGPFLRDLPIEGTVLESAESPIEFPSVFGAGVAFKTKNGALTIVAEWDHVQYTTIVESVDPVEFETE